MPLMDVIHSEGAFSPEARDELLRTLWRTCVRWEVIGSSRARSRARSRASSTASC
ncbi:MAG: hypothetical protein QOE28_2668 [Solirubrobacteraceae bacterium]|nr:hypothetical protein [Solirubrobacteraceae bacterium]